MPKLEEGRHMPAGRPVRLLACEGRTVGGKYSEERKKPGEKSKKDDSEATAATCLVADEPKDRRRLSFSSTVKTITFEVEKSKLERCSYKNHVSKARGRRNMSAKQARKTTDSRSSSVAAVNIAKRIDGERG